MCVCVYTYVYTCVCMYVCVCVCVCKYENKSVTPHHTTVCTVKRYRTYRKYGAYCRYKCLGVQVVPLTLFHGNS